MKQKNVEIDDNKILASIDNFLNDSIQNTQEYSTKQERFYKLRMRMRDGKKTFPFEGASNLRMPTGDTKIRKIKAALANVVFGIRPVVQVVPGPSGDDRVARKIEKFLDHLIMDKMQIYPKALIAIDQTLEKGMSFLKPYWKNEVTVRIETLKAEDFNINELLYITDPSVPKDEKLTSLADITEAEMSEAVYSDNEESLEKALEEILDGKTEVDVRLLDEICDYPDVCHVSSEYLYVPSNSTFNLQDCEFLCHEFFLPKRKVMANKDKGWEVNKIEEFLTEGTSASNNSMNEKLTDLLKQRREGIERLNKTGDVRIHEVYCWHDLDGDGVPEKCVITIAADFRKVLRAITLPSKSGKWPFVKTVWEVLDDRFYASRGVIEIIEDIIKEIDIQHMQKIDQQTIRNNPMFVYRVGMVNPNMVKFQMNQAIPVKGTLDLKNVVDVLNANNPNVEFSYEREEQGLLARVEELIGQMDFSLHNQMNKREARTLGEVNLQMNNMQTVFSMDATVFTQSFSELFNMIWELWCEHGKDEYEFAYFGQEGTETIKLKREELQGKYKVVLRGNDTNTNPQVRLQKAQAILQASTNPIALQTGVVTPLQIAEAYARYYQELNVNNWEKLVNMQPQPPVPPQQKPPITPTFEELTDAEKAQLLAREGIQPDIQGRSLNKQQEIVEAQGGQ